MSHSAIARWRDPFAATIVAPSARVIILALAPDDGELFAGSLQE
ncbi:hypothetical protein [Sphingopyxis sp. Root1497]|nr:hypothetical protein [Sphingopyxis sp. Root1497]